MASTPRIDGIDSLIDDILDVKIQVKSTTLSARVNQNDTFVNGQSDELLVQSVSGGGTTLTYTNSLFTSLPHIVITAQYGDAGFAPLAASWEDETTSGVTIQFINANAAFKDEDYHIIAHKTGADYDACFKTLREILGL